MTAAPPLTRPARVTAVLEATAAVLVESGYSALTVDRIATHAHASKATIYKTWPTKIDLVLAVVAGMPTLVIPVPSPGPTTAEALLDIAGAVHSVTTGREGQLLLALHGASRAEPGIADAVDEHLVRPLQAAIVEALDHLQKQSRIATDADTALAGQVMASLIIDRALASGEAIAKEELCRLVLRWMVPVLEPQVVSGKTLGPTVEPE